MTLDGDGYSLVVSILLDHDMEFFIDHMWGRTGFDVGAET